MSERETIAATLGALSANVAALTRELRLMREGAGDADEATDLVSQWIADRCATSPRRGVGAVKERSGILFGDFLDWVGGDEDDPPMTLTAFGRRLTELGFPRRKSSGVMCRIGLRLRAAAGAQTVTDSWSRRHRQLQTVDR